MHRLSFIQVGLLCGFKQTKYTASKALASTSMPGAHIYDWWNSINAPICCLLSRRHQVISVCYSCPETSPRTPATIEYWLENSITVLSYKAFNKQVTGGTVASLKESWKTQEQWDIEEIVRSLGCSSRLCSLCLSMTWKFNIYQLALALKYSRPTGQKTGNGSCYLDCTSNTGKNKDKTNCLAWDRESHLIH